MVEMKSIAELFGLSTATGTVPVRLASEHTPAVQEYVFRDDILRMLFLWYFSEGKTRNLYLAGPTGSGKSSVIEQFAARLGLDLIRVGAHNRMEASDLIGRYTLTPFGGMEFTDGPLTTALRNGSVFLLDEADLLPPPVAMSLNAVLDGSALFIPETKERVSAAPGFRFSVTGNSVGGGDTTGLHRGVQRQNLAWMNRFLVLKVGYMDSKVEGALLKKLVPKLPTVLIDGMVKVAGAVREQFIGDEEGGGELEVTLSTRTLLTWADLAVDLQNSAVAHPLQYALQVALLNSAPPSTALAINGIAQRLMGDLYAKEK